MSRTFVLVLALFAGANIALADLTLRSSSVDVPRMEFTKTDAPDGGVAVQYLLCGRAFYSNGEQASPGCVEGVVPATDSLGAAALKLMNGEGRALYVKRKKL